MSGINTLVKAIAEMAIVDIEYSFTRNYAVKRLETSIKRVFIVGFIVFRPK